MSKGSKRPKNVRNQPKKQKLLRRVQAKQCRFGLMVGAEVQGVLRRVVKDDVCLEPQDVGDLVELGHGDAVIEDVVDTEQVLRLREDIERR